MKNMLFSRHYLTFKSSSLEGHSSNNLLLSVTADKLQNAERNVVQSVSEKTVDESTDKTAETAETPKKRQRPWWQNYVL